MATFLSTFLLFSVAFCASVGAMRATERAVLIDSAIAEVQEELQTARARARAQEVELTASQKLIREFKKSSEAAQAQGMARLQFEDTVRRAEKKIIETNRKAIVQDIDKLADSYAEELIHTPGSILNKKEIAQIYESSGCVGHTYNNIICEDFPDTLKWRTADGHCNNQLYPSYGAVNTQMRRLVPAEYEDDISKPRGTMQSMNLDPNLNPFSPPIPSPRIISTRIIVDREIDDDMHSHILMQWGQFMDHDLDSMPEYVENDCPHTCDVTEDIAGRCAPFRIFMNDTAVTKLADYCLGFRRTLPACNYNGNYLLEARQHFNSITHFIDGSTLYHHEEATQHRLRLGTGGKLRLEREYIPAATTKPSLPQVDSVDDYMACLALPCFLAGDHRANEQTGLTVMHTLWAREHNRIANVINQASCTDEEVFQLVRLIVGAQIQKIMFDDYLPIILGIDFFSTSGLDSYNGYDENVDPSIPNVFATAAYRFGHSMVQDEFKRLNNNLETIPEGDLDLVDAFFDLSHFNDTGTDPVIRGLLYQEARSVDEFLTSCLTNRLFAEDEDSPGLDLASLNIMRGRDHGLPPYLRWKMWAKNTCSFPEDVFQIRNPMTEFRLYQTYGSLEDVDLFVGGLAERPLEGALVGPTFACIFSETFKALKVGDRFYYKNIFTDSQIEQIQGHTSLSTVICRNTEPGFGQVPVNAFKLGGPQMNCNNIQSLDLSEWSCETYGRDTMMAAARVANSESDIIELLQSVMEKLESREAAAAAGHMANTGGEEVRGDQGDSKESLLSDEELAEKLEALLNKFKK